MDNRQLIREIRRTYDDYIEETIRLEKDRKVTEGLLGFGGGLGSAPCHDRFSGRVEELLNQLGANAPSTQEVREVLEFIYDAPLRNKNNTLAYWMLQAVHALTERLIAFLAPEDAAALSARYRETNPKSSQLPAQKKIASRLQEQAGENSKGSKRGLLDIFKGRK